jgi:hypothetical protein
MRKQAFAGVFVLLTLLLTLSRAVGANTANGVVFTDRVTVITKHELFMSGLRFFVAPHVQIYLHSDGGKTVSIKSLTSVGTIDKARIFVKGSQVTKIIVLEMQQ